MRLVDDSTATRQPTAQLVHVLSTRSTSHGRAVNRYGTEVSAPTGHSWTTLPEKYEAKGCSGKVLTWVPLPRSKKWISGSPATSLLKRVQRSQRMHRSRSSSTRLEISIGFS